MTKEKEQWSNVRWLYDLLKRPVSKATGGAADLFMSSRCKPGSFSRTHFFELSDIAVDLDRTHFFYSPEEITQASEEYLLEFLEGRVLIAYELSEQTRKILDRIGVVYVDIWLHPIRYMDDVLFAFASNNREVHRELFSFSLSEDLFYLYADKARISSYKGYHRTDFPIRYNSALFVGQTLSDKAVYDNGRMLNLLDFKERFLRLGNGHERVYYSRHPYLKSGDEEILRFVNSCSFASIVDWPAYSMLCSDKIRTVASISSSVAVEAGYFDKEVEIWHRSPVRFAGSFGEENYASVFQEFVSPHFWAQVLKPVLETRDCPRVLFLDQKDKLRDMLGFYWGYRHVDKVEFMRNERDVVAKCNAKVKVSEAEIPETKTKPIFDYAAVSGEMDRAQVVSFDLFDTLVVRPFEKPDDLFRFMEKDVFRLSGGKIPDFRKVRMSARDRARKFGDEVLLRDRYEVIKDFSGISVRQASDIQALELELEEKFCVSRESGKRLFQEAVRKGKRVIIVSDTYFDRETVERILQNCSLEGYEKLFLSSETGKAKYTGKLFDLVIEDTGVDAGGILHIGDNISSDVEKAESKGIVSARLVPVAERFSGTRLSAVTAYRDPVTSAVIRGVLANKYCDDPAMNYTNFFDNDPYLFGYGLLGPLFAFFAKWIHDNAVSDNASGIHFLSRDGFLVHKCYDILYTGNKSALKTTYTYASRRALSVASIFSAEDAKSLLDINYSPATVKQLLENRFGLREPELAELVFPAEGHGLSAKVHFKSKQDHEFLCELIDLNSELFCELGRREREPLLEYYFAQGLLSGETIALVDIGHHATLQKYIAGLTGGDFRGYYFSVFGIPERRGEGAGCIKGLVVNGEDIPDSHFYKKYLPMFETVFLNDQGSFIKAYFEGSEVEFKLMEEAVPLQWKTFYGQFNKGVLDFVSDLKKVVGGEASLLRAEPEEFLKPFLTFLGRPAQAEAEFFKGVVFENEYSCRGDVRLLTDGEGCSGVADIWKEGACVLKGERSLEQDCYAGWFRKLPIEKKGFFRRNMVKLFRSPQDIVEDIKNIVAYYWR